MATNTSNSTHNNTDDEGWMPLPASQCIPWLFVLITECLAIVIINIITIIVFVKQRQLQRRSTYLIIHLSIVDLLAGVVSGPMLIHFVIFSCNLWRVNRNITDSKILALGPLFPFASLVNLTCISLERVHATFCPFRHRFIKKWVYGVIITFIYLTTACKGTVEVITIYDWPFNLIWVDSWYYFVLFVILVCYISIYIKVRCSRHPQHHGAAGLRERKLTSTLFLVTFGSLLTFLPFILWRSLLFFHPMIMTISYSSLIQTDFAMLTLYLANSLINPIIYAMRMPELRAGILQIIFRRAPNRLNRVDLPLRNL